METTNPHIGSSLDDFLKEEGIFERTQTQAVKEVIAWQLTQAMEQQSLSKTRMAAMLQRYMSFWLANFFDRMWVLVVAFGALLLPLSKVVPPLYVWRIRSRVYRWYGQLRTVEQALEDVPEDKRAQVYAEQLKRLDQIEEMVNQISIPLSFADGLYGLRSHINFVRKRILTLMGESPVAELDALA